MPSKVIETKWLYYPWHIVIHQEGDGTLVGVTTYNIEEDDGEFYLPDD